MLSCGPGQDASITAQSDGPGKRHFSARVDAFTDQLNHVPTFAYALPRGLLAALLIASAILAFAGKRGRSETGRKSRPARSRRRNPKRSTNSPRRSGHHRARPAIPSASGSAAAWSACCGATTSTRPSAISTSTTASAARARHIQATFRCLILHGNGIDPKAADSLNGRVHACWINPGRRLRRRRPPAAAARRLRPTRRADSCTADVERAATQKILRHISCCLEFAIIWSLVV